MIAGTIRITSAVFFFLSCSSSYFFCLQNELRDKGELLMFQLGFDTDTFALVFTEDYRTKVLAEQTGRKTHSTVEKFLDKVLPNCSGLSFSQCQMLTEFQFTDSEIT